MTGESRNTARRAIEESIVRIATGQHGVVTRTQLLEIGLSASAIRRRIAQHRLAPLHRGVYGVGAFLPAHARLMAALLACGSGSVLSHRSAAALWGLLPPDEQGAIDVTVPSVAIRRHAGLRLHRATLHDDETTRRDGVPVTTPIRSLADLATVADARELERAIARAERERLVTREDLDTLLERYRSRRAIRHLRAILDRAGGPAFTRSEAERRFLSLVRRARLPAPRSNVQVDEFEIDFFWPDHDLAVEVDGYRYHGSRVRFESDRQRGARLAALGIQLVPLTWRQIVEDELVTAVHLAQALARMRPREPDPTLGDRQRRE